MSDVRIIRAPHDEENPYFLMRRDTAQDSSLSWEARGVLGYLLSKPENWEVKPADLEQQCGRQRVYRILRELRNAQYLEYRAGKQDEGGKFCAGVYFIHEIPYDENRHTVNHVPRDENQHTVYGKQPCDEKPYTENHHAIHNIDIQSTESENTEKESPNGDSYALSPLPDALAPAPASAGLDADSPDTFGFKTGQTAYWWYDDGQRYVPGKVVRFTSKFIYLESVNKAGEVVTVRRGPKKVSHTGQTDTWVKVRELPPLKRLIAQQSYGMSDEQGVSAGRMQEVNMHVKEVRIAFGPDLIAPEELAAAYGWQRANRQEAPIARGKVVTMVNKYRQATHRFSDAAHQHPPDSHCPICGGQGLYKKDVSPGHPDFGKAFVCECRQKEIA